MNRIGLIRLVVAGAALSVLPHEASACGNMPYGIDDPMTLRLIAEEQIHVADPSHNVGVYHWDESLQRHVLVDSELDPLLYFQSIELLPGDSVEYVQEAGGGFGAIQQCEPPTIPPVVVTAPRPSFIGRAFIRIVGFFGGGGRVVVSRPVVVRPTAVLAPLPCGEAEGALREQAASAAVRQSLSPAQCASNRLSPGVRGAGTRWSVSFPGGRQPGVYEWSVNAECRGSTFVIEVTPPSCQ